VPAKKPSIRSHCPIGFALDLFGDKWTLLIVRDLLFKGKRRFGEFVDSEEGIATNILADRLTKLESHELIVRVVDASGARSREYALTAKAVDLAPMLVEMILWSAKHDPKSAADRGFVRRARADREQLLAQIRAAVSKAPRAT
jgi:DNA-binding HxlR family transcriptional regulator